MALKLNSASGSITLSAEDGSGNANVNIPRAGFIDSTSVALTGGTIDGTTIGATTASTGAFTTVDITSSGNVEGLRITSDGTTTDEAFVVQSNGLTTGYTGLFYTNSSDTGAFNVLGVTNDNTLATGSRSLYIKHDPNAEAMRIDAAGLTTNRAFVIQADALTSGELGAFYTNSGVFTNTSTGLVRVHVDNASASGNALYIQNDGGGNAIYTNGGNLTVSAGQYIEEYAATGTSGAVTIDLNTGNNFSTAMAGAVTYTFSNAATSGLTSSFTLKVISDGNSITWPTSVDWPSATAPTLSASGATDIFTFFTHDGGTTWYGFTAGQGMA